MQTQFGKELKVITGKTNARRGTPLTNVARGTNIAESSRNTAKLNVSSQVQANNLVKFTKHAKFLGTGFAAISFTSKAAKVQNSYKADGNWEKELFIESSSFAASAIVGSGALKIGAAGLTFLMLATPIGWVGLVIGGAAVLGSAAGASIITNNYVNKNGDELYDNIMKWVSDL